MHDLIKRIDKAIFENLDSDQNTQDLVMMATELMDTINGLETNLRDTKMRLAHLIERMNGTLGMEVRKRQPKMMVNHSNGACTCGYRSRDLSCKPNLEKGVWEIGGKLGNNFIRHYPESTKLDNNIGKLAGNIVDFFKRYYRTL